jgi:hypothetical protein
VGLVEEQQPRITNESDREGKPSALPRGELAMQDRREAFQPELPQHDPDAVDRHTGPSGGEPQVLGHREVVVTRRLVPDERDEPTVGHPIAGEVVPEHLCGSGVQCHEARHHAKERGLAGPVPAREENHFAGRHVEIDTSQSWEPAEETHGRAKMDDGLHCLLLSLGRRARFIECRNGTSGRANCGAAIDGIPQLRP